MRHAAESPIVGAAVAEQGRLRPVRSVRDLDEFLAFLDRVAALFPPPTNRRPPTTGDRFLL